MPSLLSPTMSNNSAGRSYTPLADEVNPSFGNTASTSTVRRNGTIVYAKRVASSSSSTSTDSEEREPDLDRQESNFRSESEVTLSASSIQKGKERATNGHGLGFEEADLGEMRREGLKGTEKRWDLEQGTAEMEGGEGRYPPLNETEEEERRVQEVSRFLFRVFVEVHARAEPCSVCRTGYGKATSRSRISPITLITDPRITTFILLFVKFHASTSLIPQFFVVQHRG